MEACTVRRVGMLAAAAGLSAALLAPTPALAADGRPMYRLYNPNSGEHFYTASAGERDSVVRAGWRYEGVGWTAPASSRTPVYRLYSGTDHHYTTSASERDSLVAAGWSYEGVCWYSDDAKGVALWRQYNPNVNPSAATNNSGSHNYTTSRAENDHLVSLGWRAEGVGWYGVAATSGGTAGTSSSGTGSSGSAGSTSKSSGGTGSTSTSSTNSGSTNTGSGTASQGGQSQTKDSDVAAAKKRAEDARAAAKTAEATASQAESDAASKERAQASAQSALDKANATKKTADADVDKAQREADAASLDLGNANAVLDEAQVEYDEAKAAYDAAQLAAVRSFLASLAPTVSGDRADGYTDWYQRLKHRYEKTYPGDIDESAFTWDNLDRALELIDELNNIRRAYAVDTCSVNPILLIEEFFEADVNDHRSTSYIGHTTPYVESTDSGAGFSLFNCLAWGYSDPYGTRDNDGYLDYTYGWMGEKKILDEDPDAPLSEVGHYVNITRDFSTYSFYKGSPVVCGFGVSGNRIATRTYALSLAPLTLLHMSFNVQSSSYDVLYTTGELRAKISEYRNTGDAATSAAKAKLDAAQTTLDEAEAKAKAAQTAYDAASTKLTQAQAKATTAAKKQKDAQSKLDEATTSAKEARSKATQARAAAKEKDAEADRAEAAYESLLAG